MIVGTKIFAVVVEQENRTEISGADKRTEQRFLEQSLDKRTEQRSLGADFGQGNKAEISGADFWTRESRDFWSRFQEKKNSF